MSLTPAGRLASSGRTNPCFFGKAPGGTGGLSLGQCCRKISSLGLNVCQWKKHRKNHQARKPLPSSFAQMPEAMTQVPKGGTAGPRVKPLAS